VRGITKKECVEQGLQALFGGNVVSWKNGKTQDHFVWTKKFAKPPVPVRLQYAPSEALGSTDNILCQAGMSMTAVGDRLVLKKTAHSGLDVLMQTFVRSASGTFHASPFGYKCLTAANVSHKRKNKVLRAGLAPLYGSKSPCTSSNPISSSRIWEHNINDNVVNPHYCMGPCSDGSLVMERCRHGNCPCKKHWKMVPSFSSALDSMEESVTGTCSFTAYEIPHLSQSWNSFGFNGMWQVEQPFPDEVELQTVNDTHGVLTWKKESVCSPSFDFKVHENCGISLKWGNKVESVAQGQMMDTFGVGSCQGNSIQWDESWNKTVWTRKPIDIENEACKFCPALGAYACHNTSASVCVLAPDKQSCTEDQGSQAIWCPGPEPGPERFQRRI